MSLQYEYLETPLNYTDNQQYESFEEFGNNNVQEEQIFETQPEVVEEQNTQNETKLRYQDADALIQAEIKEIIFKKETEKTTLRVFSEHKNNITQQIKDLQDLRDIVVEETETLNINTEIEKDEMLNLQKRVAYNGEIVGRLEEFMKTIDNGFNQLKLRLQQQSVNITNQKNKVLNSQIGSQVYKLKADIQNKKIPRGDVDADPIKEKNLILKAKVIKQQEYLKELRERCQHIDLKKAGIKKLVNEKEEKEKILNDRKSHLQKLIEIKHTQEDNINACIKELDMKKEETTVSLSECQQTIENLKKEITEVNKVKDKLSEDILLKKEYNSQLENKILKITADTKHQQEALNNYIEKCKQDTNIAQEKLKTIKNDLTEINNEGGQLSYSLELARQEYIAKIEERSNNLLLKLELDKKLSSDEVLLANIKQLDEQIALKKKTPEELLEKIEKLSTGDAVQDLNKKKAYLISSTDYLNEKLENIQAQSDNIKRVLENLQASINSNSESNRELQEKCDILYQELRQQNGDKDIIDEYQQNSTTPASILKSPLSLKKLPISPKKVQFEGISSYESSTSELVNLSGSTQQTIMGKTFDDILEEIQAESFKAPLKLPKKRRLDIE